MRTDATLESRIDELESRVRRQRIALLGCALLGACTFAASAGAPREKEIRAERFVVVDAQGRAWGAFGLATPMGVGLSLSTPDFEGDKAGASIDLALHWAPVAEGPDTSPAEARWSSLLALESVADRARDIESGVNIAAFATGSVVSPWWGESGGVSLFARPEGPSLRIENDGEQDEELGALELSVRGSTPAIEGRSKDAEARFKLP